MTKQVRVENADTNESKKVVVEIWNVYPEGDKKVSEQEHSYDTSLGAFTLTTHQYIVVKEKDK